MNRLQSCLTVLAIVSLMPAPVAADDELSGQIEVGVGTFFTGAKDSAKFEEYREIPGGLFGSAELNYENAEGYHMQAEGIDIAQDDESYSLSGGRWGSFKYNLEYDVIPHRFAYSAESLYRGIGGEDLELSDELQTANQNASSLAELAQNLQNAGPVLITDVELKRERKTAGFELQAYDPLTVQLEVVRDDRSGTRPKMGSFGFGNVTELIQPVHYQTTEYKAAAEYNYCNVYAKLGYYGSVFQNTSDTLRWDNPFRITDSTTPAAYTNPSQSLMGFANDGPATGLIDLPPDNYAHNIGLTTVIKDLPLDSRLTLQGSLGWLRQDDDLVPFTTNTAMRPSLEEGAGAGIPFDASNIANVSPRSADRDVRTTMINGIWNAEPAEDFDLKANFRYYDWENDSSHIAFPGYARFDASWEDTLIETEPVSYKKYTTGLEGTYDVVEDNQVGLEYRYDRMTRDNREVQATDDNTFGASWDNKSYDWVKLHASVEHAIRRIDGNYNPSAPFAEEAIIPQLPLLRKYDEADRDRDQVKLLATLLPSDALSVTPSFIFGRSDYDNSDFGLQDDDYQVYSVDANYAVDEEGTNVWAFYSYERHKSNQWDRQWVPNGLGDPFVNEPGKESNSNWTAEVKDEVNTVGAGAEVPLITDKLAFKTEYTLSAADGETNFFSPVGTAQDDANPFVPDPFSLQDDTYIHTATAELSYALLENMSVSVGYLWEKYDANDFSKTGYTNVPTTPAGNYNGALLMDTMPWDNYEANWMYAKLNYRF